MGTGKELLLCACVCSGVCVSVFACVCVVVVGGRGGCTDLDILIAIKFS